MNDQPAGTSAERHGTEAGGTIYVGERYLGIRKRGWDNPICRSQTDMKHRAT